MYKVGDKIGMPKKGKRRKGGITEHKELAEGKFTPPKVAGTRKTLKRKAGKVKGGKKVNDQDADDMPTMPMKRKGKKKASKRKARC